MPRIVERVDRSMSEHGIKVLQHVEVKASSFERAQEIFQGLPVSTSAIVGLGGGKALDVAKYVSFLTKLPYIASGENGAHHRSVKRYR